MMAYDSGKVFMEDLEERERAEAQQKAEHDTWLEETVKKYISEGWSQDWAEHFAMADKVEMERAQPTLSEMPRGPVTDDSVDAGVEF